jgi:very-short-patch-repair endonuclease
MKRQHVERARGLRRSMTDAEQAIWYRLRNRALGGHRFRRQHDIGPYIADFVCKEAMLVLEIDGGQHGDQLHYDMHRTAYLQSQGYRVLRFWDNDVLKDIESVLEVVWEALASAAPHPNPPIESRAGSLPGGERELASGMPDDSGFDG